MYAALWRVLPGPLWVRVLIAIVLIAAVLALLIFVVFPFVQTFTAQPEVTVESP
jgi:ABC-type transporter Mla subunit MlaD